MLKRITLLIVMFMAINVVQAQYFVSGMVKDAVTGEAIIGGVVRCVETGQNTATNNYGFYSLALRYGTFNIIFSYPTYKSDTLNLQVYRTEIRDLKLQALNDKELASISSAESEKAVVKESFEDASVLKKSKIERLPLLLGEVDVLKAAQLLPGIKTGTEGSAGIYVRGGGRGQNLVLMDGNPLYHQNHLFGFFSVFNNNSINSIQLHKGSFPARFGGRLASVVDVNLKEGSANKLTGTASLGPIIGTFNLDGPLSKSGKTTFSLGARRTYLDLLIKPILNAGNTDSVSVDLDFFFYDVNLKVAHQINNKNKLLFTLYNTKDVLGSEATFTDTFRGVNRSQSAGFGVSWASSIAAVRLARIQKNNIFADYGISYTRYRVNANAFLAASNTTAAANNSWLFSSDFSSGLDDINLFANYDYKPSTNHHLRYGATSTIHLFKPIRNNTIIDFGGTKEDTMRGTNLDVNTIENAIYLEDVIQVNRGTKANVGLRIMQYITPGKTYHFVEPRIALNEELDSHLIFRMSYALNHQPLHLLTTSNAAIPFDLWVPATANIKPQTGHQLSLGFIGTLKHGFQFVAETYFSWLRNTLDFMPGAEFISGNTNWENQVMQGTGSNYGLELYLQKQLGAITGWASYTLAYANRNTPGINNGVTYPFRYDQRHNFSTTWNYNFDKRRSFGTTMVIGSGYPITIPVGQYYDIDGQVVYQYAGKNNYRMDNYFRIDVNYIHHRPKRKLNWAKDVWYNISIYNVTARQNPFRYDISRPDNNRNGIDVTQLSLFTFVPSFSYNIAF